jgi:hypothetical protein
VELVSDKPLSAYQAVEDCLVRAFFGSVLCDGSLGGPLSARVLDRVEHPSQIPALLRKVSASVATLRMSLVNLKRLHAMTINLDLSVREHDLQLTVLKSKHQAVMSVRQFVSLSSEAFVTKFSCVSPALWEIQTAQGEQVSTLQAEKVFTQMASKV